MNSVKIMKRRLGNYLSRPFGICFGFFALAYLILGAEGITMVIAVFFVLTGIVFGFGKEMTEINFGAQTLRRYFQFLFLKIGKYEHLPLIDHYLVRDFHANINYNSMQNYVDFYEVSFITDSGLKTVLALCRRKSRVHRIINRLMRAQNLSVKDTTREKILNQTT